MPRKHRIVALHPISEAVITPRTYDRVKWGIAYPSGRIDIIQLGNPDGSNITTYYKTDHRALSRLLAKGKASTFVAWESRTQRYLRDAMGNPIRDKSGRPYREIRLGGQTRKRPQRGVLFSKGKRKSELDLGFQPWETRNKIDVRNMKIIEPGKENIYTINLRGPTLKKALSKLIIDVNKTRLIKTGRHLIYTYILRIIDPDGNVVDVVTRSGNISNYERGGGIVSELFGPQNAEFLSVAQDIAASGGFELGGPDGQSLPAGRISILANLYRELSTSLRRALALTGYHFTELAWLESQINKETPPDGRIERGSPAWALKYPVVLSGRGRKSTVSASELQQINPTTTGHTVELTTRFEII